MVADCKWSALICIILDRAIVHQSYSFPSHLLGWSTKCCDIPGCSAIFHLCNAGRRRLPHTNIGKFRTVLENSQSSLEASALVSDCRSSFGKSRKNKRHPRGYWSELNNVRLELVSFWTSVHVPVKNPHAPSIPNNALLDYFGAHDLKYGITAHGGRLLLRERLGSSSRIIPGKWKDALKTEELQMLLNDPIGSRSFSTITSPLSLPPRRSSVGSSQISKPTTTTHSWKHKPGRKRFGYWNRNMVVSELYQFLRQYGMDHNLPSIWMPRMTDVKAAGRADLLEAIHRYGGGLDAICETLGLIRYDEWGYFSELLELVTELKKYLDCYLLNESELFPSASLIKSRGYEKLYKLIRRHGGKKYVATRFGMKSIQHPQRSVAELNWDDMNWGEFDLDFATSLLNAVRNMMMSEELPSSYGSVIKMPSAHDLLGTCENGKELIDKIQQYGGRENVARRLGLFWSGF